MQYVLFKRTYHYHSIYCLEQLIFALTIETVYLVMMMMVMMMMMMMQVLFQHVLSKLIHDVVAEIYRKQVI